METRTHFSALRPGIVLCTIAALVLFSVPLFSQEKKFTQKLQWEPEPNALEYKVEIQSANDTFVKKTFRTEKPFVEFSMPAGEYTYRIFTYDFLGRQASVTEWKPFSIKKAIKPEIHIRSETVHIEPDENAPIRIPANVEKITPNSNAVVINEDTGERIEGTIEFEKSGGTIVSGSVVVQGLKEGNWKVVIQNPGGLYSESEPIHVQMQEKRPEPEIAEAGTAPSAEETAALPDGTDVAQAETAGHSDTASAENPPFSEAEAVAVLDTAEADAESEEEEEDGETKSDEAAEKGGVAGQDIQILASFAVPFVFYDENIKTYAGSAFNWGVGAKIQWLPIDIGERKTVQFGLEISGTATQFSMQNDYITVTLPMLLAQGNLVTRINFGAKGKVGLNIKFGGGVSVIKKEISYTSSQERENPSDGRYGHFCANGGLSVDWIVLRHFVLEAGADFTHIFITDMNTGMLNAYLAAGIRF